MNQQARKARLLLAALLTVCLGHSGMAWAVLGGDLSSVENDRQNLAVVSTSREVVPQGRVLTLRTYEFKLRGMIIRETAGPTGQVIAVSWRGLTQPSPAEMQTLLGSFFEQYEVGSASVQLGRRFLRQPLITKDLKIVRGGHVPNLHGMAFLLHQLPENVHEADIP